MARGGKVEWNYYREWNKRRTHCQFIYLNFLKPLLDIVFSALIVQGTHFPSSCLNYLCLCGFSKSSYQSPFIPESVSIERPACFIRQPLYLRSDSSANCFLILRRIVVYHWSSREMESYSLTASVKASMLGSSMWLIKVLTSLHSRESCKKQKTKAKCRSHSLGKRRQEFWAYCPWLSIKRNVTF